MICNSLSATQELSISGSFTSKKRRTHSDSHSDQFTCSTLVSLNIVDIALVILSVRARTDMCVKILELNFPPEDRHAARCKVLIRFANGRPVSPPPFARLILTAGIHSVSSVLNSRFLLGLHETNVRLEGAADTTMSSLSFNAGSSTDPRAGPPELPEFLSVIGGSIHTFHDADEDVESLEFRVPPPLEERQCEPDGEPQISVELSSGDGGDVLV